jgi:nitrate reductase gamma subunit
MFSYNLKKHNYVPSVFSVKLYFLIHLVVEVSDTVMMMSPFTRIVHMVYVVFNMIGPVRHCYSLFHIAICIFL